MKYFNTLFFVLLLTISPFSQAAFILEGEQEAYNFSASDFNQSTTTNNNGVHFGLSFVNSLFMGGGQSNPFTYNGNLELGESLTIDFYENQGDVNPFQTSTLIGQDSRLLGYTHIWADILIGGNTLFPWRDHEGSVVFTVLSGEIELKNPYLNIYDNGTLYSTNSPVAAVPLPPSLLLFTWSLLSLFLFQRKNRKI